jgi:3-oxoacyl-[acyl-carrier protein] reductase
MWLKSERENLIMEQQKRNIVITGGNSGMGRAMAEIFVRMGEQVAILGRNQDTLRGTAEALAPHVTRYQTDQQVRRPVEER